MKLYRVEVNPDGEAPYYVREYTVERETESYIFLKRVGTIAKKWIGMRYFITRDAALASFVTIARRDLATAEGQLAWAATETTTTTES